MIRPSLKFNILGVLRRFPFFAAIFALLLAAHLCHSGVLWPEEDLPLAAALRMFHGSQLYRDIWFDKPPLVPAVYLLWGARAGVELRIAGAVYGLAACLLGYGAAAAAWGAIEGYWAAAFIAFFLTFDTHSSVLPLAADLLLLVPHLAAVMFALRRQAFLAGFAAGIGFLFNTKAVFVLAACALFAWPAVLPLVAGFAIPNLAALAWLAGTGSLAAYIDQVWRWPALYAASPVVADPVHNGIVRTLNWLGFHAVLVIGAALVWFRRDRWRYFAWALIAFEGVVLGWRFFPRYYFLLLPPLAVAAARGMSIVRNRWLVAAALATMIVPLVRFGPGYATVATSRDLALDRDSRAAARIALDRAPADSTLYVWGYRPEIYVYTGFRPATKYLECQALTGVPADRHLTQSRPVLTSGTSEARRELAAARPDVLIDSLSLYNPALSMSNYPELRAWLSDYEPIGRTGGSVVYLRHPTIER